MRKFFYAATMVLTICLTGSFAIASTPAEELAEFQQYYLDKFPDTPKEDFINGIYSIDAASRETFDAIEEFAPYEIDVAKGEEMYNKPFADGSGYANCFAEPGVRHLYPQFDSKSGKIVTLEGAINACRKAAGEKPLKYKKGAMTALTAYMAYESRGNIFDIKIPDDERALAQYNRGKRHWYQKRGQLNMACADCHLNNAGNYIRSERLSPALGHLTHFPVYRAKWGGLGTPHRRIAGCNEQVRAKAFKAQSDEYKALEYFLTYMSNGLEANGPATRK
ncbi:MAG: sulfur oxidation c-type cytochrome SoxA [Gammaproteobacteria bacterium]|nr:sulfur oxidation c-type cytochrome SoxA [Gammaproteobacteria bacterium]